MSSDSATDDVLAAELARAQLDGGIVVEGGRISFANVAAEDLFGATSGQLRGYDVRELIVELDGPSSDAQIDAWFAERCDEDGEDDLVRLTGERFPARICVAALGQSRYAVTLQDISEQRAMTAAMDAELVRFEERRRALLAANAQTIRELSLPVLSVWEGVLAVPLIGALDRERAADTTARLLDAVVRESARFVIIDLTGLTVVDLSSVDALSSITRTLRLIGSSCVIAGISPALAIALVDHDIDLGDSSCFSTQREALRAVLERLDWSIAKGGAR